METKTADKATITKSQEKELQKLSPYETQVKTLTTELQDLTIKGVDDREGIKAAHEGRMALKELRINIDKQRKELIDPALKWQRMVNDKAKEMTEQIKPIEDRLQAEENRIKEEKRKIKEAKERERMEKLRIRTTWLSQHGGVWDVTEVEEPARMTAHGMTFTEEELMDAPETEWLETQEMVLVKFAQAKLKQRVKQTIDTLQAKGMELIVPAGDENVTKPHLFLDYMAGTYTLFLSDLEAKVKGGDEDKILALVDGYLQEKKDILDKQKQKEREESTRAQKELEEAKAVIKDQRLKILEPLTSYMGQVEKDQDPGKMTKEDFDRFVSKLEARRDEAAALKASQEAEVKPAPTPQKEPVGATKPNDPTPPFTYDREEPRILPELATMSSTPLMIRAQELCQKIIKSPFLIQNLPEAKDLERDLDKWLKD